MSTASMMAALKGACRLLTAGAARAWVFDWGGGGLRELADTHFCCLLPTAAAAAWLCVFGPSPSPGRVHRELGEAHNSALEKVKRDPALIPIDQGKSDIETERLNKRLAQDREEAGHGFVMTANNAGDNFFARQQTEGVRLREKVRMAAQMLWGLESFAVSELLGVCITGTVTS